MSEIVFVSSQKKEMGKTIIAIKLSLLLSQKGKRVLLMDLSTGSKKISQYLNVEEDVIYDIKDVLDNICTPEHAEIEINNNLKLLPSPRLIGKLDDYDKKSLNNILCKLNQNDVIILDIDELSKVYMADIEYMVNVITINNNEFSSIRELNNDIELTKGLNLEKLLVVINRYDKKQASKGNMIKINDMKKMIENQISCTIEENEEYNFTSNFANEQNKKFDDIIEKIADEILN